MVSLLGFLCKGVGIVQWLECQICDQKVEGLGPGRIDKITFFFSRVNFPCSYISICST